MATPMSASTTPTSRPDPVPANEVLTKLFAKFKNLDDVEKFENLTNAAMHEKTRNFVVRFGAKESQIALNLGEAEFKTLLDIDPEKRDARFPVTWINIWAPVNNQEEVQRISDHYKFSTRLKHSFVAWDSARRQIAMKERAASKTSKPDHGRRPKSKHAHDPEQGHVNGHADEKDEKAEKPVETVDPKRKEFCAEDLAMFKLLQRTYNYTTIDHGTDFMCIGANWLHERPVVEDDDNVIYDKEMELVPPKHWAWYALTTDCTVISIQEEPYYHKPNQEVKNLKEWQSKELANMRKNTLSLLSQLSVIGIERYQSRFSAQKGVRSDLLQPDSRGAVPRAKTASIESAVDVEASSNLFYYLFEDYAAGISILDTSRQILADMTREVLHITDRRNKDKDTSAIIKTLYARSKDLRQLKHLFESYEKLIGGIISLGTDRGNEDKENIPGSTTNLLPGTPPREVKLSQKAFDRFDRLNARMKLLMLDTIQEYLDEKTSLSDTYFNLIAQKDSQATSRLTRSATLLAKLSVFFLPISFMTSYFSIQIPELNVDGRTYWIAFAVVCAVSFMSLFFFSRLLVLLSDVLDEKVKSAEKWVRGKKSTKDSEDDHLKML